MRGGSQCGGRGGEQEVKLSATIVNRGETGSEMLGTVYVKCSTWSRDPLRNRCMQYSHANTNSTD